MTGKNYLLVFNDGYADEHNVPALACVTEDQYQEWLKQPTGKLLPDFDEKVKKYNEEIEKYNAFTRELDARGLYAKHQFQFTAEEKAWYDANQVPYPSYDYPKKVQSGLRAQLGNGGFEDNYSAYYLMQELVDHNIVKVHEVTDDFYMDFHRAGLDRLSLCNVFARDVASGSYYSDEDDD